MKAYLFVHLVAMAFFVGGQLVLAAAVVPVERSSPEPERMRAMARRFGWGSLIALLVLAASGAAMASDQHLWGERTLQIKLGLVAATIVCVALHLRFPRARALMGLTFLLSLAVVWAGISLAEP